jgi:hypothetical protein
LVYGPNDQFDLAITAYRGRASEQSEDKEDWDWAAGFEAWPTETFSFGLSYQSDLADADDRLLEDGRYLKRVPVASAYLLIVGEDMEFSFETVTAMNHFRELENDLNQPMAWNTELAFFFPDAHFDLSFRFEKSRELEDEPKHRFGTAISWYPYRHTSLTLEYLHGEFRDDSFAIDRGAEIPIRHVNTVSAKLSLEF